MQQMPQLLQVRPRGYDLRMKATRHGLYQDYLDLVPDAGVDLIIIDPPYETTNLDFDKSSFDFAALYEVCQRKLKQNGWLFAWLPIERYGEVCDYFRLKFPYVWVKSSPTPNHDGKLPMMRHEPCCAFIQKDLTHVGDLYMDKQVLRTKGDPYIREHRGDSDSEFNKSQGHTSNSTTVNTGYREGTSVLSYPSKSRVAGWERSDHPTQKPLALYELLVRAYCPPDGLVFDPCAGSGTAAVAAHRSGRGYICVERDERYYKMMRQRLEMMLL